MQGIASPENSISFNRRERITWKRYTLHSVDTPGLGCVGAARIFEAEIYSCLLPLGENLDEAYTVLAERNPAVPLWQV